MLFAVLVRKAYRVNLQYRSSHLIHNLASSLFGFMYIFIWMGIGADHELEGYGVKGMVSYVGFTQAALWVTTFATFGLGIPERVRTGQISLDLMRPVSLFYQTAIREWGQVAYQFVYKTIPIYLIYFFVFSLPLPTRISTYAGTLAALIVGAYLSICIQYLVGIVSLWTTESTWFHWVHYAFSMLLSGFFVPIEWLPSWLRPLSLNSFYPYLQYHPVKIYMEHESFRVLGGGLLWCLLFTIVCAGLTVLARQKVEVQGG
ncbi:ABC transporter permease [Gorillibacterium timonense]|uniref:ABC transporter permease n=1 Tax=Gorillibacterium timonense TaxID=1689269 RepID=UPI00071E3576|nr:ABC-2 family transporter protein [Gorillibacterium timonense]